MKKSLLFTATTIALLIFTGLAGASPPQGIGVGGLAANDNGISGLSAIRGDGGMVMIRDVGSGGAIAAVSIAPESAFVKTILYHDGSSGVAAMKTAGTESAFAPSHVIHKLSAIPISEPTLVKARSLDGEVGWIAKSVPS